MKPDSSNRRSEPSDFLLIRPAAVLLSLGMVLPEYLVLVALSAFLPMMVLAIIQTINRPARKIAKVGRCGTPKNRLMLEATPATLTRSASEGVSHSLAGASG
jgi:hypothetical protein